MNLSEKFVFNFEEPKKDGFFINNRIIKIANSNIYFQNNPLYILKCVRYAATLNLNIDIEVSKTIRRLSFLVSQIPLKDIKEEFVKLLCGNKTEEILRTYSDVIEVFIPEIRSMYDFDQHTPYHLYDVWEHTLHAVGISENLPIIRVVLFFHDIAKPDCLTIDNNGIGHFKGHALLGANKTRKILERLEFSDTDINDITIIIANHRYSYKNDSDIKKIIKKIGRERFNALIKVKYADDSSKGFTDKK